MQVSSKHLLSLNRLSIQSATNKNITEYGLENYYWRQVKDKKYFNDIWSKIVQHKKKKYAEWKEYLFALAEAYSFCFFSRDCIAKLCKKKSNNDMNFLIRFFFYSFINNAKKVLDVTALLTRTAYELPVKQKQTDFCNLHKKIGRKYETVFFLELEKKNKNLAHFLLDEDIQKCLREFYEVRTVITHRHAFHTSRVTDALKYNGEEKVLIPTIPDHGTYMHSFEKDFRDFGEMFEEPVDACNRYLATFEDITKRALTDLLREIK